MMKAKWLLLLPTIVLAGGVILAACGGGKAGHSHGQEVHGDETWETTASYQEMPLFLSQYSGKTKQLYEMVGKYKDIMALVNCYCGCMEYDDAHASLLRCYIAGSGPDGIVWSNHSSHCGICLMELEKIDEWSKAGHSPEEIKQMIDNTFNPA